MQIRNPVAFIQMRANLLPAMLTGMKKPLGPIYIGKQESVRFLAEGTVARFGRNRHK